MAEESKIKPSSSSEQSYWPLYISMLFSGVFLLAEALGFAPLQKSTAKIGIALIYSTFILMTARGKKISYIAAGLIWLAVFATWLL